MLPTSVYSELPEPQASQYRAIAASPRRVRNMRDEQSVYRDVFAQARALTTFDNKPLVVVTTTESLHKTKGWSAAQDQLASLSTNSQHRTVEATHGTMLDDEASFGVSATAIGDVVESIRADQPVVSR